MKHLIGEVEEWATIQVMSMWLSKRSDEIFFYGECG